MELVVLLEPGRQAIGISQLWVYFALHVGPFTLAIHPFGRQSEQQETASGFLGNPLDSKRMISSAFVPRMEEIVVPFRYPLSLDAMQV